MQNQFSDMYVPEKNLSHDEAMIKYFGRSGLKQSIRKKPIRLGFKAWVLTTVSGFVVTFELYRGSELSCTMLTILPLLKLLQAPSWTWWTSSLRRKGVCPATSSLTISFPL
jgi:hypothetical protein